MRRYAPPLCLTVGLLLVGCVAPSVSTVPAATPTPAPTATVVPTASPTPSPSASAVGAAGFILGKILDEAGLPIEQANVLVQGVDSPGLHQEVTARRGSYFVGDLPMDQLVKVRVSASGYGTRERLVRVAKQVVDAPQSDYEVNFGAEGNGKLYALPSYPEISSTVPTSGASEVVSSPLVLKLQFSEPLDEKSRLRAASLLRLRFRAANVEQVVTTATLYNSQTPQTEWNAEGNELTMTVPFPLVTRDSSNSPIILDLNPDVPISLWPMRASGKVLGRGEAMTAYDALGGKQQVQAAAFLRDFSKEPVPSASPTIRPEQLWGLTHQTGISFRLAQPQFGLKLVSVKPMKAGGDDTVVVTFDRPVRGFPEEALGGSALAPGNYRLVVGMQETKKQQDDFAKADPVSGGIAPMSVRYMAAAPEQVQLIFPGGTFGINSVFKFYADGAIQDIAGQALVTDKDPATGRPASVVEGAL